jgi:ABC-type multidrug transport system ATPase subunit
MVAHRLETAVQYCDKILVLDEGRMVQFDHPLKLLVENEGDTEVTKVDSKFAEMVRALEADQQERIVEICKKNQQQ